MEQVDLLDLAITYSLTSGLLVRTDTAVAHAPFSLYPSPFPRASYIEALQIQPLFNILVDRLASDRSFLESVMKNLNDSDDFTSRLWKIYLATESSITQKVVMGIHRSDYMLHNSPSQIKQVELNTISVSFASLSKKVDKLHRYLFLHSSNNFQLEDLPENVAGESVSATLFKAFDLYDVAKSVIMMIVQPGEKNIYDQRLIQQDLFQRDDLEVAVSYYRAGYSPVDYPSEAEWEARETIERSHSIKCPNVAYHLVGSKKVQQMIAERGILEKWMSEGHSARMRKCFVGLYDMGESEEGRKMRQAAIDNPFAFVLKPQREGGGNNYYGLDIKKRLETMNDHEREGYILMDLIKPTKGTNFLVRAEKMHEVEVLSELGVYGMFVKNDGVVVLNEHGGHLLRTKAADSNEGGVAAGFAVLDSPLLY